MGSKEIGRSQFKQTLLDEVNQLGDRLSKGLTLSDVPSSTISSKERKSRKELEKPCKGLEDKFAAKERDLESAKAKVAKLKCGKKELKEKLREIEAKCTKLQQDNEELQSELEDKESVTVVVESNIEELQAHSERQDRIINSLHKKILKLETRADLLKPLVDIGASTRLRFLQQARETIYNHPPSASESKVIKKGNEGAHRGNGLADAALFKADLVAADSDLAKVFKRLYHCKPTEYLGPNEITMLSKILDCEASVRAVRKARGNCGSAQLREEHNEMQENLYSSLTQSTRITAWEEEKQHKSWLAELERLTNKIVNIDRRVGIDRGLVYATKKAGDMAPSESETESSESDESADDSSSDSEEDGVDQD